MAKKCCFTGYRPQKLRYLSEQNSEEYQRLYRLLTKLIKAAVAEGYDYFISGFAQGVDLMAAEIVISLRNEGAEITLEAALPAMNQTDRWNDFDKGVYFVLLDKADHRKCVEQKMTKHSCLKRDAYMVNQADLVIAVYDGKRGGTDYTVRLAREKNRNLWIIDPHEYTVMKEESLF